MRKSRSIWLVGVLVALLVGCAAPGPSLASRGTLSPAPTPKLDRNPPVTNFERGKLTEMPSYDTSIDNPLQFDLRSYDLTDLDLSKVGAQMRYATFDDKTTWPQSSQMPAGFDYQKVMEIGKNPGLGLRGLHDQGITGKGVGIAILDMVLQTDHPEYRDQLRLYEEINIDPTWEAQMHGPAVASLAVGKTVGTASGADLYYIADWFVEPDQSVNFTYLAKGIRRILEVNRGLPADRKIRVMSISRSFGASEKGYQDLMDAIGEAEKQGIPVISVGMFGTKTVNTRGLGRDLLADPDQAASYSPAVFLASYGLPSGVPDTLWIPIDARTTASPTGTQDYVYYGAAGMSWAEPYLAGVYALACQVDPKLTPERFWKLAVETGQTVKAKQGELGPVINPVGLIQALKK